MGNPFNPTAQAIANGPAQPDQSQEFETPLTPAPQGGIGVLEQLQLEAAQGGARLRGPASQAAIQQAVAYLRQGDSASALNVLQQAAPAPPQASEKTLVGFFQEFTSDGTSFNYSFTGDPGVSFLVSFGAAIPDQLTPGQKYQLVYEPGNPYCTFVSITAVQ